MKKTTLDGKLSLRTETIAPLTATDLHDVNGGTLGPIIKATLRYCTVVTTVVSHPVVGCNGGQQ